MFGRCSLQTAAKLEAAAAAAAPTGQLAVLDMETEFLNLGLDIIGLGVFNYDFGSITRESPVIKARRAAGVSDAGVRPPGCPLLRRLARRCARAMATGCGSGAAEPPAAACWPAWRPARHWVERGLLLATPRPGCVQAVYGVLKEAEHRSTFYIPYWNLPLAKYLGERLVLAPSLACWTAASAPAAHHAPTKLRRRPPCGRSGAALLLVGPGSRTLPAMMPGGLQLAL